MKDLIDRQSVIDTEGLDAQIRCEMCRNPMHTNRGCDGNCKYDEKLYERIMQILGERIKPLPSAQPETSTEIQEILDYLDTTLHPIVSPDNWHVYSELHDMVSRLPSAQPEIVRCKDCKHWTQTTGNMRGFGLGDCDYINAKLVNCNGFCYWAERRTDGEIIPE